jgi:Yip1 domain
MTNAQLAGRLLTAPRRFFDDLAESPRFALPMWAIVLCTAGLVVWFYSVVDLQWIVEQQLQNNPRSGQMTDAQREAAGRFMTRGLLTWGALIATVFFLFAIRLLEALYYRIAGKATGHARSYRQWFAFAWWTSLPGLIGVIPSIITLAFSRNGQIDPAALQPLSLNALFFHLSPKDAGYQVLSNVSVLILVSLALTAFGVRAWSKRSWLYSLVFTLLPITTIGLVAVSLMVRR